MAVCAAVCVFHQLYLLMLTVLFIWELIYILLSAIGNSLPHPPPLRSSVTIAPLSTVAD